MEQEIDQTEKLLDNAKNSISQLEANLATANSIIAQLQYELAAAKIATPQLKADLATVNTTISNLQADLTTANSSIAQLTKSNSNLASDLKKEKEENYHFRWHWQDGVNKDFSNFVYRNSRAKGDKTPGFHIAEYLEVVNKQFSEILQQKLEERSDKAIETYVENDLPLQLEKNNEACKQAIKEMEEAHQITVNNLKEQLEKQEQEISCLQQKLVNTPTNIFLPPPTYAPAAAPVNPTAPPSDKLTQYFQPWFAVDNLPATPNWKDLHQQIGQPAIDAHHCATSQIICNNIKTTPWAPDKNFHPYSQNYNSITGRVRERHTNWYEQANERWDDSTSATKFSDWLANIGTNVTPDMWEALIGYNKKTEKYNGWATGSMMWHEPNNGCREVWVSEYFLLCLFWWLYPKSRQASGKKMLEQFRKDHPDFVESSKLLTSAIKEIKNTDTLYSQSHMGNKKLKLINLADKCLCLHGLHLPKQ